MTDLLADLLPCPFCGGRAEIMRGGYTKYVMCRKCEVMGPNLSSDAELTEAWNTRHQSTEIAQAVRDAERLRAYIKLHVPCTCHYSGRCGQREDGSYYGESSITHKCMRCEVTDDAMRGGGE